MISIPLLRTVLVVALLPFTAFAESVIEDKDRIVFIGDSITGQGANGGPNAWIGLIGEGVKLARPESNLTLTGLGGSGATVGAWQNFEVRSRTGPVALDVKENDVGKTLDAGTEIAIFMLGMNDVLAPALNGEQTGFDAWIVRYAELIESVRIRCNPRVIALATVTPCTEDSASPKNLAIAELNRRISTLAKEKGFLVLPASETSYEILNLGRQHQPDFHVTGDYVHPNSAGHLAIAVGMLRGLGEEKAASLLLAKHESLFKPATADLPAFSYTLTREAGSPDDASHRFQLKYHWTVDESGVVPEVTASGPTGWTVKPEKLTGADGSFELTGPLERAMSEISLSAVAGDQKRSRTVSIPAGWRITTGKGNAAGWTQNSIYDPENDQSLLDEAFASGEGFAAPVAFPKGEPSPWTLFVASNDFTGGSSPGSIDLAAVDFFSYGHQACGARWIHSDRERMVNLETGSRCFAGMYSLSIWLNGQSAFAGKMEKKVIPVNLRKGWNQLNFRSTFIQWQWQFSIDVKGVDGDDLLDLRYATKPPMVP